MSLKCPICGKKYYYDAKVCKNCEDYSIKSNLIFDESNKRFNWNCNRFFDDNRSIFSGKSIRTQVKLLPEPKDMRIILPQFYEWNCDSRARFVINNNNFNSKVKTKTRIPLIYMELDLDTERENSHLIYE